MATDGNRKSVRRRSKRGSRLRRRESRGTDVVPFFPLDGIVVFPHTLSPLVIEDEGMIRMLEGAVSEDRIIGVFPVIPHDNPEDIASYTAESSLDTFPWDNRELSRVGTLVRIVKLLRFPDESVRVLVRGLKRIRMQGLVDGDHQTMLRFEDLDEDLEEQIETVAIARNAMNQFQQVISMSPHFPEELRIAVLNVDDNVRLVDLIADTLNISFIEKLHLLAIPSLLGRLQLLTILLNREMEVLRVGSEIQNQVHATLGRSQREYFLREQLKTIRKELGEDVRSPDLAAIAERMDKLDLPDEVKRTIEKEMERLEMIPQASPEYNVAHTYVDWLLSVPWGTYSEDRLEVAEAAKILDADHYDLKDVKERILDFLAVLQLKEDRKSPILCFVGPPGVGKTSLGQSIARAMGRQFVRMSLGGVRDEAEIRGHRRTYVGALPGRIVQGMKRAGTSNPVFMLDEIDKLGVDFRGDPASALLEVLDPQQNVSYADHYLELDYDLSSVMFIATANITDTIPPALLDRMELIHLPGYTPMEKKQIARRFLIPRQLRENGLKQRQLFFPAGTIDEIVSAYTREAGVRILERTLGTVCRKIARKIVNGEIDAVERNSVQPSDLESYLGSRKYFDDEAETEDAVGIAVGMAWTSAGGALLPVEVTSMPGKGQLLLTGSLGDVMKESAQAAFSFIRHRYREYDLSEEDFSKQDFHIHVPDGATPKDGPSAGITMAAAMLSHITGQPIRGGTAMTGEITLRGRVTPVGGIKEKVIAALRAGIRDVVLPEKNRKDLADLPDEARNRIRFHFVRDIDEALAFLTVLKDRKQKKRRKN